MECYHLYNFHLQTIKKKSFNFSDWREMVEERRNRNKYPFERGKNGEENKHDI